MTEAKESTKRALPKTSIKSVQREIASLMIGEEMGIGHDPGWVQPVVRARSRPSAFTENQ